MQSRHAQCAVAATALSRQGRQLVGREGGGGSRPASRGNFATPVIAAIILVSLSCLQIYYHDQLPLRSAPPLPHFPLSSPLPALTDPQLIFISLYFVAFVFVLLPNANCPAAYHASLMPAASLSTLPSPSPTPALSSLPLPIPSHWPARALPLPTATNRIWKCENAENCKMLTSLCPPPSLSNPLHQCAVPLP